MAQLNQIIWSNITWGACGIFFMFLFGIAIKSEWNSQLTPKTWNRPRNVLKNVLKRHKIFGCINFYPFTWCLWAHSLTYGQGMEGIPGTGTRDDGWTGPTLKMNLDGVILLKFHKMLFKIGVFATLLSCGVLLPVYTSSVCDPEIVGERECQRLASLTDFENLTISHVPEVRRDMLMNSNGGNSNGGIKNNTNTNDSAPWDWEDGDDQDDFYKNDNNRKKDDATNAMATTKTKTPVVPAKSKGILSFLHPTRQEEPSTPFPFYNGNGNPSNDNDNPNNDNREWNRKRMRNRNNNNNDNNRKLQTMNNNLDNKPQLIDVEGNIIIPPEPVATIQTASSKWVPGISWRHLTTAICSVLIYIYTCYLLWHEWIDNLALRRVHFLESDHYPQRMQELDDIANLQTKPEDPIIAKRPPFVPHPEMREVPPNVSLYSVLYQLPVSLVTFDVDGETQMDRQLVATVDFFNECVPAQQGFTSSVVAATIIPDAARVAKCWVKWYKLEKKVRRVRYIRKIIRTKQQKIEDGTKDIYDDMAQALKNSNHAMKTVAKRAYRRVSQTASAALKKGTTTVHNNGNSNGSNSGSGKNKNMDVATTIDTNSSSVEMMALVGDHDHADEKQPLVLGSFSGDENNEENQQLPLLPLFSPPSTEGEIASTDVAFGNDDHVDCHGHADKAESDDEDDDGGGFWQNIFRGKRKDQARAVGKIDGIDVDTEPYEDNNTGIHNSANGENDLGISEEFEEGSFINSDSTGDIETQGAPTTFKGKKNDQKSNSNNDRDVASAAGSNASGKFCGALTHGFKYENYDVKQYAKTISHNEETELIDIVDGLGIEELSVFAREYAQASSSPCPLGCFPNSMKLLDIEDLREMEEGLWIDIKILNEELIEARENVVKLDDDFEVEPTMIPSAAFDDGDEDSVSTSNIDTSRNEREILLDSPTHRAASGLGMCKLRNRSAVTTNHQHGDKTQDVANNMKEIPVTAFAKRISVGFSMPPSCCPSDRFAKACYGGRYNPCFKETLNSLPKYYGHMKGAGRAFVTALDHPSYAVVTFSSRQAAIAARQCLADGGANNSWRQIDEIPIPPLADAPPRNICFCRGCCRPVTLTLNYKEKTCRRWSVYIFMLFFCCFYTLPLAFISLVLNPRWLGQFFPNSRSLHDPDNILYRALAGPASGLATTLFMALLPQIFKCIAYYEGTSSSLEMAERKALLFMWYFMLVTAFFGQYLATMLLQWYYHADVTHITQSLWSTMNTVATLIPSAIAPQWLNWIIIRYGFIWPGGYFFQINTFLTKISGMTCINRVVRGGGAGAPTPYRIYVDSGIVLLCIVGLSPMVPIVAPIATMYFIVVQPMLRWLLIFVYRPRYDTGGERWPLCHQIVISSLIMAQILTSVTLALKGSLSGAVFVGCCTFPTVMFSFWTEERFLRPYKDTALLQTSRLDGGQDSYTKSQREEFRRWLVDCHKASYVPTCLLGSKENLMTLEPAVVISKDRGDKDDFPSSSTHSTGPKRTKKQKGGIYHRKHK